MVSPIWHTPRVPDDHVAWIRNEAGRNALQYPNHTMPRVFGVAALVGAAMWIGGLILAVAFG